jgi:hypothetical protein
MKTYSSDSNPDIPSWDALKQCFDEDLGVFLGKVTVEERFYDLDGKEYAGYTRVTWEEIERRKPIVGWFGGFVVTWTDVVLDYTTKPRPGHRMFTYPNNRMPMHVLPPEERERIDAFFEYDRRFTGSRNDVRRLCHR